MAGKEKEIKAKIKLEGEKEYSAALQTAQRNLKTLRSELKAETAELGANATAQEKNRLKAENLKKQIAEQEKVVETYRKQLAEVKRDYGDNEDVVQKYTQQLNYARATLGNMQGDLQRLSGEYRNVGNATNAGIVATKSFADSLASIGSVGDSISSSIEDIFTGMISTVVSAVEQLWDVVSDSAARANNYTDIAGYWGTDAETIQKYAGAVEATAKDFADLETVVSRIVLGGKTDKITEMLGVSDVNYTNQWDYAMAVMDRIHELDKSGGLADNFWEEIFGEKKSLKAMNLVRDWEAIQEGLATFDADAGGHGATTEGLQNLNELSVSIASVEAKLRALKMTLSEKLAPIALNLMVNVHGSLDALNDFMKAETEEERAAAIKDLEDNITEFFKKIADALRTAIQAVSDVGKEFQGSDDPILKTLGDIMVTITDALSWFMDENNIEKVKAGIGAIFGIWLTAKLAAVAAKLTSIIAQINLVKTFSVGKGLLGAFGGSGAAEAVGSAAGGAAGGGLFALIGSGIKEKASSAASSVASGASTAGYYLANTPWVTNAAALAVPGAVIGGVAAMQAHVNKQIDDKVNATAESIMEMAESVQGLDEGRVDAMLSLVDGISEALSSTGDMGKISGVLDILKGMDLDGIVSENDQELIGKFGTDANELDQIEVNELLQRVFSGIDEYVHTVSDPTTYANPIQPNTQDSETASVMRGAPKAIAQAVTNAMSGFSVRMDGATVGRLVAPYVSQQIARDMVY